MKKITFGIVTVLVALILTTGVMAAGNVIKYKGYPVINIIINGLKFSSSDIPAISVDGKNFIPLNSSVEKMDGIVNWNEKTKTATIIKPETSIFFILLGDDQTVLETNATIPILDQGKKFYSEVNIGGIPKGTYTIKSKIIDSKGIVVSHSEEVKFTIKHDYDMDIEYFEWDSIQILPDIYKYKLEMKDSSGVFRTIATKTIRYEEAD